MPVSQRLLGEGDGGNPNGWKGGTRYGDFRLVRNGVGNDHGIHRADRIAVYDKADEPMLSSVCS